MARWWVLAALFFWSAFPGGADAQQYFDDCASGSSITATLILPADTNPSIDGQAIPEDAEIAVKSPEGLCVGRGIWDGGSLGITIFGEEELVNGTTIPGMTPDTPLAFAIWDPSSGQEFSGDEVAFALGDEQSYLNPDPSFSPNAIYKLDMFAGVSSSGAPDGDCVASDLEEHVDSEEDTITLSMKDPEGVQHVAFVDAENQPALTNLVVEVVDDAMTSADGIWWSAQDADDPPTDLSFTLTPEDEEDPDVAYFVRVTNSCGSVIDLDPAHSFEPAPAEVKLLALYPNPAQDDVTVRFQLPEDMSIDMHVYNMLGQRVATLTEGRHDAGRHDIQWTPSRSLSSGTYAVRLYTPQGAPAQTITIVR